MEKVAVGPPLWRLKFMLFAGVVTCAALGSLYTYYLVTAGRGALWSEEVEESTFIEPTHMVIHEPLESTTHRIIIDVAPTISDNAHHYPIAVHTDTPATVAIHTDTPSAMADSLTTHHTTSVHEVIDHTTSVQHEFIPAPTHADRTDPMDVTREVIYGPWTADIPATVVAGNEFDISFECVSADLVKCPPSYMVLLHGPTRLTIPPESFYRINVTHVQAKFSIHDAGTYHFYAYAEFLNCIWGDEGMEHQWNQASVQSTPLSVTVLPSEGLEEGGGVCSSEELLPGRYLSTKADLMSGLFAGSSRQFAWAPFKCKIPPRTTLEAVDLLPSAKHILFVGDSTTRGPFCLKVWGVKDADEASHCEKRGDKHIWKMVDGKDGIPRNISFSFLWGPTDVLSVVEGLLSLDPPPTHVLYNVGLSVLLLNLSDWLDGDLRTVHKL